jgi:ribosomal protein S27AE
MGSKAKVRKRLYAKNQHCPRCGVRMVLPEHLPRLHYTPKKKAFLPTHTCTYEHKYTKLQSERKYKPGRPKILCKKCNEESAREVELKLPIEKIRKRSGRHPVEPLSPHLHLNLPIPK